MWRGKQFFAMLLAGVIASSLFQGPVFAAGTGMNPKSPAVSSEDFPQQYGSIPEDEILQTESAREQSFADPVKTEQLQEDSSLSGEIPAETGWFEENGALQKESEGVTDIEEPEEIFAGEEEQESSETEGVTDIEGPEENIAGEEDQESSEAEGVTDAGGPEENIAGIEEQESSEAEGVTDAGGPEENAAGEKAKASSETDLLELIEFDSENEILNVAPAMAAAVDADGAHVCEDLESTLEYVRGQTFLRSESITVQVPVEVYEKLDLENYLDVCAHTGDPRGGDYLRCSMWYMSALYDDMQDGTYVIQYLCYYHNSASEEQEADAETARLVEALGLKDSSKSDYDKVKAIHDYITANVEYDYDTYHGVTDDYPQTYSGYGAIVRHLAVCQGFAAMFYRLALEAGIDARIITSGEMKHAWNIVKPGSLYYLIDCTWDENSESDTYFLRGKKDFADHENKDDNFQDTTFASNYPLSDFRYGFSLNNYGKAPDYTLIANDHRTISLSAKDGRAKAVVFYFEGCGHTQALLESLRGKQFEGVDFIYAYMMSSTESQQNILSEIGKSLPTDVPGVYTVCSNNSNALYDLEEMCGIRDPDGYVYSPTIFLINADNDVVLAQKGNSGGIEAIVRAFLENPDAPEQPAQEDFGEFTAMGVCGNNAVWHFYEDGTLRISGEGALWENTYQSFCTSLGWTDDYLTEEYSSAAENIRADAVKKIIVDSKITGMGMGIFHQFTNLESITFRGAPPQGIDGYIGISDQITVYFPDNETGWAGIDKSRFPDGTKWISLDAAGTHHHKWGAWKTTKAATVYEEGKKQRSCTECGKTQSAVIEKREPVSIENAKVSFPASIVYNGKKQEPSITVKVGSVTLKAGSDYTAVYSGNTNAGTDTAKVTITGKENYKGTIEKKFSIAKANQELTVTASKVAVGKNVTVSVKGAKGAKTFKTADSTIAAVTSEGVVTGKKVGSVRITVTSKATANFNAASGTVTVKVLPAATAKITTTGLATGIKVTWGKVAGASGYILYRNGTRIATLSGNANVTYTDKNANTNGAKYTYKVVAKASTGTSTLSKSLATYKVARPAVSSVTNSASKKMTVKWGKNAKATGYQIQYSTGKTFPSGSKTVTVKGAANVSKAIGSLTKGKTYYVRIRTYKTAGGRNYWSVWSAAKSVKITK